MFAAALGTLTVAGCVGPPAGVAYVQTAPPRAQHEEVGVAPGPDYIWVPGYHAWRGGTYVWISGRWDVRPHAHARWHTGRWHHNHHGWFWIDGRWR
jgi:hypothetical protein